MKNLSLHLYTVLVDISKKNGVTELIFHTSRKDNTNRKQYKVI